MSDQRIVVFDIVVKPTTLTDAEAYWLELSMRIQQEMDQVFCYRKPKEQLHDTGRRIAEERT